MRSDVDEETVYALTKAFWDNLDQVTSDAPWAKALNPEFASESRGQIQLHAGAERYYREVGAIDRLNSVVVATWLSGTLCVNSCE